MMASVTMLAACLPAEDRLSTLLALIETLNRWSRAAECSALMIERGKLSMAARTLSATQRVRAVAESYVHAIRSSHARTSKSGMSMIVVNYCKALAERAEEADTNALLLEAIASCCQTPPLVHTVGVASCSERCDATFDMLAHIFVNRTVGFGDLYLRVFDSTVFNTVAASTTVWHDAVAAGLSTAHLVHSKCMDTISNVALNQIFLVPRVHTGVYAEYACPSDVTVFVNGAPVIVVASCVRDGIVAGFELHDPALVSIELSVCVCDVLIWSGRLACASIIGRLCHVLPIARGDKFGMAVSNDGDFLAVSYFSSHQVRIYRIEHASYDITTTLLHTIGGAGSWPKRFQHPFKMCTTAIGTILVCDLGNDRIQELGAMSEVEPAYIRSFPVSGPRTVACHRNCIAVGTKLTVELFAYDSGDHIRSLQMEYDGLVGNICQGLRFSIDGASVFVAEHAKQCVTVVRTHDGTRKLIAAGMLSIGENDIAIAPNGDVIVADCEGHRIIVLSADGGSSLRVWGGRGTDNNSFMWPTALALVNRKLFVLEYGSMCIKVFE